MAQRMQIQGPESEKAPWAGLSSRMDKDVGSPLQGVWASRMGSKDGDSQMGGWSGSLALVSMPSSLIHGSFTRCNESTCVKHTLISRGQKQADGGKRSCFPRDKRSD